MKNLPHQAMLRKQASQYTKPWHATQRRDGTTPVKAASGHAIHQAGLACVVPPAQHTCDAEGGLAGEAERLPGRTCGQARCNFL
eukprot:789513-Pelagomonas_calceolata.AAC.5